MMENTFLTTVLAGVVVAMVGGIIAFYFGRVQERKKRREEREKELTEEKADALAEIRNQAHLVVEGLESWAEEAAKIVAKLPNPNREYSYQYWDKPWENFFYQWLVAIDQEKVIADTIQHMRENYRVNKPYLEITSQQAFEAFDEKVRQQYTLFRKVLHADVNVRDLSKMLADAEENTSKRSWNMHTVVRLYMWKERRKDRRRDEKEVQNRQGRMNDITEAVRTARKLGLRAHLNRLDAEADRVASLRASEDGG